MARICFGGVRATVAIVMVVAVVTASTDNDEISILDDDDADDQTTATRRRQVRSFIYHVDEQVPVGSLVGDVRANVRSACEDYRPPADCDVLPTRFVLLHQRPNFAGLFSVHETTGVVRSSGVVDREEICFRQETVCSVVLEVAVHYADVDAFDVAVVEVSKHLFIYIRTSTETAGSS